YYFSYEAVVLYIARWDIIRHWQQLQAERGRVVFEALVTEPLGEYAKLNFLSTSHWGYRKHRERRERCPDHEECSRLRAGWAGTTEGRGAARPGSPRRPANPRRDPGGIRRSARLSDYGDALRYPRAWAVGHGLRRTPESAPGPGQTGWLLPRAWHVGCPARLDAAMVLRARSEGGRALARR